MGLHVVDFRFCPKWTPQEDHPALCPATSEFRVTDLGGCLLILLCLADSDMQDFLCVHSRQMCSFHNSNASRIAVKNVELNNSTFQDMKTSLYTLTAFSAACLVRMNGLTSPHGLSPGEKQIHIFCIQGVVEKYFVQISTLLKDCFSCICRWKELVTFVRVMLLSYN